jgi:hypothetical protein
MRFAIIFGRTHDEKVVVAAGPGNTDELNRDFKQLSLEKENEEYSELFLHEIYLSQGRKRAAFVHPDAASGDGLHDLSVKKLHTLANKEGVDLTGSKVKQEHIARIRAFRSLNKQTTPELKQLASEEKIDVGGCEHKKDFVNTIAAAQRERSATPNITKANP